MKSNNNKLIKSDVLASDLLKKTGQDVRRFKNKGKELGIAFVAVGDDPASKIYLSIKRRVAERLGIKSIDSSFDKTISTSKLVATIKELNKREDVTGILVQLPLPAHIDLLEVLNSIDPNKDVDGFTVQNVGRLVTKQKCLVPCTPQGCLALIKSIRHNLSGAHAVVLGRSNIVGRPMAELLLQSDCSVTMLHSRSINPQVISATADVLIAAVGQPGLVTKDWVKQGAIVIDVGITRMKDKSGNKKLLGDVDLDDVIDKVKAITPVPGGVGPMTIAYLMKNIIDAAELQNPGLS
jgi:methylenetetrahydrofolate dehydrogenase (NADP+)/methenyltetrahydrofolate cyclohydrolase